MKRIIPLFALTGIVSFLSFGQTYIPITDNMQIQSYSNIKFAAGDYTFPDAAADGVIQVNGVNNVTLDDVSCFVNGLNDQGYMIKITNSDHITLQQFNL